MKLAIVILEEHISELTRKLNSIHKRQPKETTWIYKMRLDSIEKKKSSIAELEKAILVLKAENNSETQKADE